MEDACYVVCDVGEGSGLCSVSVDCYGLVAECLLDESGECSAVGSFGSESWAVGVEDADDYCL